MTISQTTPSELLRHICVDNETAIEHTLLLQNKTVVEVEGSTIYSGDHPEHGSIHIVIPMAGDGVLLLPFALHRF